MSDNQVANLPTTDLTVADMQRINAFFENGAPGFDLSNEFLISKMMDLYLSGKTYSQIASINRVPKDLVMAYSHKLGWYDLKLAYLQELELHMKDRIVAAKIQSQDFLLQLTHMWQKKIGKRIQKYLATEDEEEAHAISLKEIDKYLKTVETLNKLASEPTPKAGSSGPAPAVGINVGDGVSVTKKDDGTVEITPKQKTVGSMLEILANKRREEEAARAAKASKSDIKEVNPKSEGENGNDKK